MDQDQAGRSRRRLLRDLRHRQRLEDDPEPDRRRDARRPVRLDHVRQLEHGLVAGLHRDLRLARDVRRRQGGREGCAVGAPEAARDRIEGARDRAGGPRGRRRRGDREGRAAEEDQRARRRRCGDLGARRADHRHRRPPEPVRGDRGAGDRPGRLPAARRDLLRGLRRGGRGRRRDRRGSGRADVAVLRRRPCDQPDARRGSDPGRRPDGARPGCARGLLPVLPVARAPRRRVRLVLRARDRRAAEDRHDHHREPLRGRPVRREGDQRDGQQPAAAGDRDRGLRRDRRLGHRAADHARARPAGAGGEGRRARAWRASGRSSTRRSR